VRAVAFALLSAAATSGVASADRWSPIEKALVQIPAPSAEDLHAARFGTRAWRVRFEGDRLLITPAAERRPSLPFAPLIDTAGLGYRGSQPTQALRVGNDWFLAYYYGEFGGALWEFDSKGTAGKRLLSEATYGLVRYGDEILAETQDNSMMVRNVRIHRFALRRGIWQEIGGAKFPHNVTTLTLLGSELYAAIKGYPVAIFSKVDLAGREQQLWRFDRDLEVSSIAQSKNGQFALGATGYVVRLRRTSHGLRAAWYAPRDCVSYSNVAEMDGGFAHCVGLHGTMDYEKHSFVPVRNPLVSRNGNWIVSQYSLPQLLHFTGAAWLPAALPALSSGEFPNQIDEIGSQLILRTTKHSWLRRNGQWRSVRNDSGCPQWMALTLFGEWGLECADTPRVLRIGFDGKEYSSRAPHGDPEIIAAGLFDDAWFSEKGASFIGHVDAGQPLREIQTSSPITSISRGGDKVWFTESDKSHYGYIDASNSMHELKEPSQYVDVLGISGTPDGTWIRDSLAGRMILYYIDGVSRTTNYVADIRYETVSPDGSVWALSSNWLTVVHATENGEMTRYRLPCLDAHALFFPAPNNGIWVQSYEPHCNALIDATGIHVRDLPLIERIDYQ